MSLVDFAVRASRRAGRTLFLPRFHPRLGLGRGHGGYITCAGKHDRVGAQTLAILSTMVFADRAGLRYVHTPFQRMDRTAQAEVDRWEAFFNLAHGELLLSDIESLGLKTVGLPSPAFLPFSEAPALYVVRHCHDYANRFPDEYKRVGNSVSRKYAAGAKDGLESHYDPTKLNIALHVRRDDVTPQSLDRKYTANEHLTSVLRHVLSACTVLGLSPSVHLYSDGHADEFDDLRDQGWAFHLRECPFSTFNNLVEADVLIMSKSTFSYVAALLSRGVPIYESFRRSSFNHRPLGHWLRADDHGRAKRGALVRALDRVAGRAGRLR
ncbi:MAG: hypothetical protein ABL971_16045 [Vicinamibacterales bacterium]